MAIGDQDGATFFRDGDAASVLDAQGNDLGTLQGHFRLVDSVEHFGAMGAMAGEIKGTPTFEYWTANAPAGFVKGCAVMVNGQKYTLRTDPMAKGDGKVSIATLVKA